jgi:hypothetical protein
LFLGLLVTVTVVVAVAAAAVEEKSFFDYYFLMREFLQTRRLLPILWKPHSFSEPALLRLPRWYF